MKSVIHDDITTFDKLNTVIKSDVQSDLATHFQALDAVGMSGIQSAILINDQVIPATLDLSVNLKAGHRGIHMSRLYQLHMEQILKQKISTEKLVSFLQNLVSSQAGISSAGSLKMQFQLPVQTKSLKSNSAGFRIYPVTLKAQLGQTFQGQIDFEIVYSSTCPQSAKLSKEYFQGAIPAGDLLSWYEDAEATYPAVPHAQRSRMQMSLQFGSKFKLAAEEWISFCEKTIQTPVQTFVKKADEMEFARLNAENLMFCEDAIRLMSQAFLKDPNFMSDNDILGFKLTAQHEESLHSHNATSSVVHNYSAL